MSKIYLDDFNSKRFREFTSKYEQIAHLRTDLDKKIIIGISGNNTCRYCGKSKPQVTFRKAAHVIPEFLGNKHLLSNFECDRCNDLFSKYEDAFSKFLGPLRTLTQIRGKSKTKIPKFVDHKTKNKIYETEGNINLDVFDSSKIIKEMNEKKLIINTFKNPYIPLFVYKALIKIGIAILDEREITSYDSCLNFLKDNSVDDKYSRLSHLFCYFIPFPFIKSPEILLFRKRSKVWNTIPRHCVIMNFKNSSYQFFLPGHLDNEWIYENHVKELKLPIFPLLCDYRLFRDNGITYQFKTINLTSNEKLSEDFTLITLNFDKSRKFI